MNKLQVYPYVDHIFSGFLNNSLQAIFFMTERKVSDQIREF